MPRIHAAGDVSTSDRWTIDPGLVAEIAGLLSAAHPLRIGSALRRADALLIAVRPPVRAAAILDRAIGLALASAGADRHGE
ncbi:hypothetical protein Aau02nite_84040 [Amorphoplanes auranticolor]|uniref:Uncharacterized protein n=1 Tax=Actinoplanes auranticolor TaxID=47988 RepID=A0A919SV64_9ACTN|nr:hypothetical protein Aau02nite_84040 [Actinoplanes auranticolor]